MNTRLQNGSSNDDKTWVVPYTSDRTILHGPPLFFTRTLNREGNSKRTTTLSCSGCHSYFKNKNKNIHFFYPDDATFIMSREKGGFASLLQAPPFFLLKDPCFFLFSFNNLIIKLIKQERTHLFSTLPILYNGL